MRVVLPARRLNARRSSAAHPRTTVAMPSRAPLLVRLATMLSILLLFAIASIAVSSRVARAADPLAPKDVPEPLKPWTAWALDGSEATLCPTFEDHADTSRCAWPSRLDLALDEHGGRVPQSGHLDA